MRLLAVELNDAGVLDQYHIQLLGTGLATIEQAEDREKFKQLMQDIHQPIPASLTVHSLASALQFADQIGYPVIVRPAYTLGGTGGGIAATPAELTKIATRGLAMSPVTECLIEKSIAGFKGSIAKQTPTDKSLLAVLVQSAVEKVFQPCNWRLDLKGLIKKAIKRLLFALKNLQPKSFLVCKMKIEISFCCSRSFKEIIDCGSSKTFALEYLPCFY